MVQTTDIHGSESTRSNRVYLIGMPGVGKSSVARELNTLLGWTWFDTDACVVCGSCMTIPQIFARYGEEEFRKRESDCLYRASLMVDAVIATGGGSPLYRNAMDLMLKTGTVIYLEASVQTLLTRLRGSESDRPLLTGTDTEVEKQLRMLLLERKETYELAHKTIQTDGKLRDEIAGEIGVLVNKG
jgi:shikimate kinase